MSSVSKVYKVLLEDQWQSMQEDGYLIGAPIDIADGYIHLSTLEQLPETLALHFAGLTPLALLELPAELPDQGLRWEASRKGQLFPHYYGRLCMDVVQQSWILHWDGKQHPLPQTLLSQ